MNFNKPNHSASLLENIAESFLFTNDGNVNEESLYVLQNILAAHGARFYYDRNGSLVIEQSQEGIQLENNQEKSPLEIPDLVVFPALVSNSIRTYTLNESNIGKNRKVFNILNTNNETVFVTRAQLLSWGVTLYIYDMDRRPLLLIDQKNLKLNSTYNFCDPKTRKVFCQGKKKIFSLRSHYTIRDTKRELLYTVDGDFFCNNYHIRNAKGEVLSSVREQDSLNHYVNFRLNTYQLRCQPKVDVLMMLAITLMVDCTDKF